MPHICQFCFISKVINSKLNTDEIKRRYPSLTLPDSMRGCIDPLAGIVKADEALRVIWVTSNLKYIKNVAFISIFSSERTSTTRM